MSKASNSSKIDNVLWDNYMLNDNDICYHLNGELSLSVYCGVYKNGNKVAIKVKSIFNPCKLLLGNIVRKKL